MMPSTIYRGIYTVYTQWIYGGIYTVYTQWIQCIHWSYRNCRDTDVHLVTALAGHRLPWRWCCLSVELPACLLFFLPACLLYSDHHFFTLNHQPVSCTSASLSIVLATLFYEFLSGYTPSSHSHVCSFKKTWLSMHLHLLAPSFEYAFIGPSSKTHASNLKYIFV